MSYESTTAVPGGSGERGVIKQADLTESDSFPYTLWIPPDGKKAVIDDILVTVREIGSNRSIFEVQIRKGGSWETMIQAAQVGAGVGYFDHTFAGKIASEKGNGTAEKVRITKPPTANTTNFSLKVLVVGHLVV